MKKSLGLIMLGAILSLGAVGPCLPGLLEKKVDLNPTYVDVRDSAIERVYVKVGDLYDGSTSTWREHVHIDIDWDGSEVTEEEWQAYVQAHFNGDFGNQDLIQFYDNGVRISADKISAGSRDGATVVGEIAEGIQFVSEAYEWIIDNGFVLQMYTDQCVGVEPNRHCYTGYELIR